MNGSQCKVVFVFLVCFSATSIFGEQESVIQNDNQKIPIASHRVSSIYSSSWITIETNTWILDVSNMDILVMPAWSPKSGETPPITKADALRVVRYTLEQYVSETNSLRVVATDLEKINYCEKWIYTVQIQPKSELARKTYRAFSVPVFMSGKTVEWKRRPDPCMNYEERTFWNKYVEHKSDVNFNGEVFKINPEDITVSAQPFRSQYEDNQEIRIDIMLKNISSKTLPVLEPALSCVTKIPYDYKGMSTCDYSMLPRSVHTTWLHLLRPNQSINLQVILEPMSVGRYQLRFFLYRKNLSCVVEIVRAHPKGGG